MTITRSFTKKSILLQTPARRCKKIDAGVATEEDYILKAMVVRVLYGDEKHNLEALECQEKAVACTKLAHWYNDVVDSGFRSFNSITGTIHTPAGARFHGVPS